ncbi:hypothetical protein GCM10007338_10780 [Corynebacterium pelargi]|nr:hypothetical protein GCM10007338_10780 [Corynebacterium pelargi]
MPKEHKKHQSNKANPRRPRIRSHLRIQKVKNPPHLAGVDHRKQRHRQKGLGAPRRAAGAWGCCAMQWWCAGVAAVLELMY